MIGTSKKSRRRGRSSFRRFGISSMLTTRRFMNFGGVKKKRKTQKLGEERDRLLESPEYEALRQELSFGPTYDYLLADIENPEYLDAFGGHPLNHKPIREEYNSGTYGKEVIFEGYGKGVVECLAYDYGDFYYKFIPEGKTKPVYITMVAKYESD